MNIIFTIETDWKKMQDMERFYERNYKQNPRNIAQIPPDMAVHR